MSPSQGWQSAVHRIARSGQILFIHCVQLKPVSNRRQVVMKYACCPHCPGPLPQQPCALAQQPSHLELTVCSRSCLQLSVSNHGLCFFDKPVTRPFCIISKTPSLCFAFLLHADQLSMAGEIWQAGTPELFNALEVVISHELLHSRRGVSCLWLHSYPRTHKQTVQAAFVCV